MNPSNPGRSISHISNVHGPNSPSPKENCLVGRALPGTGVCGSFTAVLRKTDSGAPVSHHSVTCPRSVCASVTASPRHLGLVENGATTPLHSWGALAPGSRLNVRRG